MTSRSDELRQFKDIDLIQYAVSRGYVIDRKASSRASVVVRHPRGDKLIIGRSSAGQYYYFNAKGNDSGTIIDLCQSLDGGTIGDVRKTLRYYDGSPSPQVRASALPFELQPSQHDAARVLSAWMQMQTLKGAHPYLTNFRRVSEDVQADPIFRDRIRTDARGNAVFPHFNQSGLCGFELKNGNQNGTTFTGFSPGGVKGLACSRPRPDDRAMIVCETAVDMLSLATLEGTANKRFFSTAGQISPYQAECLRRAASKMTAAGSRIMLAFDNDEGGRKLTSQVRDALKDFNTPIADYLPPRAGADWNDILIESSSRPSRHLNVG